MTEPLRCTFCTKTQHQVSKLIAGPMIGERPVCICNECVKLCNEIIGAESVSLSSEKPKRQSRFFGFKLGIEI